MEEEVYYELYGEHISLGELAVSTAISTVFAMLFFHIAPQIAQLTGVQPGGLSITLGAIGATVGFAISSLITRVKRVVAEV
ncbi:MAG: hypothetical protein RMH84_00025 [Sulfolobales archaeon]|nr:hypothetical protein [Sulfolobales archaeon]MCX8209052.1 hypothetical protein [Sulfolobales archaeon]MDW8009974.1 hypothetical protein [Sulfolobales archaeon]